VYEIEAAVVRRLTWRLVPFLFLLYIVAYLDRINVGFAALQMRQQLAFTDAVYGLGAGMFFAGYFFFQVPSNLALQRVGARRWIALLMMVWGVISASMVLVSGQRSSDRAFIVWRITAKKRMVAKLKAIKAELQRRKHHRTTRVGAWLRTVVLGYYQYHAVPGNSTQLRIFQRRVCWLWRSVLVRRSQRAQMRWARLSPVLNRWVPQPRTLHPYPDARFAATHPQ
jgi:hypothetical protein